MSLRQPPSNQPIERRRERPKQFFIADFLGMLKQPLDHGFMSRAIHRLFKIGEDLLSGPWSRILLPPIGQDRQPTRDGVRAQRRKKSLVSGGEEFFKQQM